MILLFDIKIFELRNMILKTLPLKCEWCGSVFQANANQIKYEYKFHPQRLKFCSKQCLSYHKKTNGRGTGASGNSISISKIKATDLEFIEAIKNSFSFMETLKKLNCPATKSKYYSLAKERVKNLNLDISHFKKNLLLSQRAMNTQNKS